MSATDRQNGPFAVALDAAQSLLNSVDFDNNGAMIAGEWRGGNGGLVSRETTIAADRLRKALAEVKR